MTRRRPSPQRVKIHFNYTVEDVATMFGIHKNTVREWIRKGLPLCDARRPALILGADLRKFLQTKQTERKRRCLPGEMYCLRCRQPRRPALDLVEFKPVTACLGNLVAICPACDAVMNQRTSLKKLPPICAALGIPLTQLTERIEATGMAVEPRKSMCSYKGGGRPLTEAPERRSVTILNVREVGNGP